MIRPKYSTFSFVTDPNGYKSIDIPCYTVGILEGMVTTIDAGKKQNGQSGVSIHIVGKDPSNPYHKKVPVYSDGSFYFYGLPPGDYTAYVDPVQCELLNVNSNPLIIIFQVKPGDEGDYKTGIDFELVPKAEQEPLINERDK
jgi:hypothetical protein